MQVITRYRVPVEEAREFLELCRAALEALVARPGCTGGRVGRAVDDPQLWSLTSTWTSVGSYRRALSGFDVKVHTVPLMYRAVDEPSAYESLLSWDPGTGTTESGSALSADAEQVNLGEASTGSAPHDV